MPNLSLTHFEAAILLAICCSAVLGVVTRRVTVEDGVKVIRDADDQYRLRYGLRCLAYFVGAIFVLGWLMYFGHR
jgi:hypothetical protein